MKSLIVEARSEEPRFWLSQVTIKEYFFLGGKKPNPEIPGKFRKPNHKNLWSDSDNGHKKLQFHGRIFEVIFKFSLFDNRTSSQTPILFHIISFHYEIILGAGNTPSMFLTPLPIRSRTFWPRTVVVVSYFGKGEQTEKVYSYFVQA